MDSLNIKKDIVHLKNFSLLIVSIFVASLFLTVFSPSVSAQPVNCWQYDNNETGCLANSDVCLWNDPWCNEIGCWNFFNSTDCNNANSNGLLCNWNNQTSGSEGFCVEPGCWDYQNQSACDGAPDNLGCSWDTQGQFCDQFNCWEHQNSGACSADPNCQWDPQFNFCDEIGCWNFDFNYSGCVTALNGTCNYNNNSNWCQDSGCWDFWNESSCGSAPAQALGCSWENFTGGVQDGWCEELGCWNWDGNETGCGNASSTYGLNCAWDAGSSMCYYAFTGCSDHNNQFDCSNTYYCVWNGTACKDPAVGGGEFDNPSCDALTDFGASDCGNVSVCTWGGSTCNDNTTGPSGVQCENITQANLCNNIHILSTCCSWNGTACKSAPYTNLCWDSIEPPPEGAFDCRDYNVISDENLCNQIQGDPWFMPCVWNSEENECDFDSEIDLSSITSKSECEYSGGIWISDTYCSGTDIVSAGHCEADYGVGSFSCYDSCWACEFQGDGSDWGSVNDAKTACEGSPLGFCQWETDSAAPNGLGWCFENEDIGTGGGNCDSNCFDCNSQQNAPQACGQSQAGCEWYPEPGGQQGDGHCGPQDETQCTDDCFACHDSNDCLNIGLGGNACEWDNNNNFCKPLNFNGEICFNEGVDDDGDGFSDCADSDCLTSDFCGGDTFNDCANWNDNASCVADGCVWRNETWGEFCDFNGSQCFDNDNNKTACDADSACNWFVPPEGGMCDINSTSAESCFGLDNSTCSSAPMNSTCMWRTDDFNNAWCEPRAFECFWNFTLQENATLCNANSQCNWTQDPWGGFCGSSCFSLNQSSCDTDPACEYRLGFCDPVFFEHGGFGGDNYGCFEFDFNETACNAGDECSWQSFPGQGACEMDYSTNCFQNNQTVCQSAPANATCGWFDDGFGGSHCGPLSEQCFFNQTYQQNATLCNQNNYCSYINESGWQACEPTCFNSTNRDNQTACGTAAGCGWRDGYCESTAIQQTFQGVEAGDAVMISFDNCPEGGFQLSSDICGVGIKDSPSSLFFGIAPVSLEFAAMCNGIAMGGGGVGNGFNTSKYYLYLDTDGNSSSGCTSHDGAETGFEFHLSYISQWTGGSLSETRASYICTSGSWGPTDIPTTGWNEFACKEVSAAIVGVEKTDFERFPDRYDRTKDMRIYATTADNTTNKTNPLDSSGPGYYTIGTVDFRVEDCGEIGVDKDGDGFNSENDPDCADFNRYGYVPVEEGPGQCTDNIDNDGDKKIDCNDESCWYETFCGGSFNSSYVNTLNDTTAPRIIKSDADVFTDSAFVDYATDEPANGTLTFYYANIGCSGNNISIYTTDMIDPNFDNYTMWHDGPINNYTGNPQPINGSLALNTTYYYRLNVCDPSNNCGESACLNFTTPVDAASCTGCNFSFRFEYEPESSLTETDPAGNIQFSFDYDGDGSVDEVQGGTCGETVGIRIDHTIALSGTTVIHFENPNSTDNWSFNFNNVTITDGLSSQLTNLIGTDMIFNETPSNDTGEMRNVTYVGIDTSKWLDLREEANVKSILLDIPGNWNELWHCSYNSTTGNISNCYNVTNQTLSGPSYNNTTDSTSWTVPSDIGFSVFGGAPYVPPSQAQPPGDDDSNSPGGGGPGGGVPDSCTEEWSCSEWGVCSGGTQTRTCTDLNECGTEDNKPSESQTCEEVAAPDTIPDTPLDTGPSAPITGDVVSEPGPPGAVPGYGSTIILLVVLVIVILAIIGILLKVKK